MTNQSILLRLLTVAAITMAAGDLVAQQPTVAPPPGTCLPSGIVTPPAYYQSLEVLPDRRVTFRVCAPAATEVRVTSNDIVDVIPMSRTGPQGLPMTRDAKGLWSVTTDKPFPPDTYRFNFNVNSARVPDPQGTTFSSNQFGTNSTFEVPGPEGAFQTYDRNVPHGLVSTYEYWSKTLGMKRRAHVYTPPGYLTSSRRFPVLYLVHGAGDSDDSWTSIGHAHYILDNLIAAGRAKQMIIVMPFGHTPDRPGADILANNDFGDDLIKDLLPKIDHDFRTLNGPDTRALLDKYGIRYVYNESTGGHTWINWRRYLNDLAPRLFK